MAIILDTLESLSTYTRRRMTQAERAEVADVRYIPAALALRQRPGVPGIRDGTAGGQIVAQGMLETIKNCSNSLTGKYI